MVTAAAAGFKTWPSAIKAKPFLEAHLTRQPAQARAYFVVMRVRRLGWQCRIMFAGPIQRPDDRQSDAIVARPGDRIDTEARAHRFQNLF